MERVVLVVAGPTCSAKSTLAFFLASWLGSGIISADSRQVYRGLNIGTAKPPADDLAAIPHHCIDIIEPGESYDASRFESDALSIINDYHSKGKIPVVCGGTGLYIRALVQGIVDAPGKDEEYRKKLFAIMESGGTEALYDLLIETDSLAAAGMLHQNWKRVMRALEVFHLTGKSIVTLQAEHKRHFSPEFRIFAPDWKRDELYRRIEGRTDRMFASGLVHEVNSLAEKGFTPETNALNTVGYKEVFGYLAGEYSYDEAVSLVKRNTRHYAKRQITWFRTEPGLRWIPVNEEREIPDIAQNILRSLNEK